MNHNYYYTLLGRRAGGASSTPVPACVGSLQLRYSHQYGGELIGAESSDFNNWALLAFGNFVTVWSDGAGIELGHHLWLDAALTQAVSLAPGTSFRSEQAMFTYDGYNSSPGGVATIAQFAQPAGRLVHLSAPSQISCQLEGPYVQPVWVGQDSWQQVDRIWLDDEFYVPFPGGNNWYHVNDSDIPSSGTTLRVNDCGWVVDFHAC